MFVVWAIHAGLASTSWSWQRMQMAIWVLRNPVFHSARPQEVWGQEGLFSHRRQLLWEMFRQVVVPSPKVHSPRSLHLACLGTSNTAFVPVVLLKDAAEVSQNRKLIGAVGCCEALMAKWIHWWTERWLECRIFHLSIYLLCIYPSIHLSILLFCLPYPSLSMQPSICHPVYVYVSICLSCSLLLSFEICPFPCLSICLSSCGLCIYLAVYLPHPAFHSISLSTKAFRPSIYLGLHFCIWTVQQQASR